LPLKRKPLGIAPKVRRNLSNEPQDPSGPLTPDELAELRSGVDVVALQELISKMPDSRALFLAYLSADDRLAKLKRVCEAFDDTPQDPARLEEERLETERLLELEKAKHPSENRLAFLPSSYTSFELTIDCHGDRALQRLVLRALGIRSTDWVWP
jgi:hypothetical protein